MIPGEYLLGDGDIVANAGRRDGRADGGEHGDRPIQVGSHFHFFEANRALRFDRGAGLRHAAEHPGRHRRALRARRREARDAGRAGRRARGATASTALTEGAASAPRRGGADGAAARGLPERRRMTPAHPAPAVRRPLRPHHRRPRAPGRHRAPHPGRARPHRATATRRSSAAARSSATAWASRRGPRAPTATLDTRHHQRAHRRPLGHREGRHRHPRRPHRRRSARPATPTSWRASRRAWSIGAGTEVIAGEGTHRHRGRHRHATSTSSARSS